MASIQFRGISATLAAFENRGIEAWSLWDGKAFMFKGIGVNELTTILESLDRGGTTAVYTLKVYEDITEAKKIKSSTECDGSFNFRLYEREDEQRYLPGRGLSSMEDKLTDRMNQFEDRVLKLLEKITEPADDGEDQPAGFVGTITGLLEDPDKLGKLINLGKSIFGQPVQPAYVGNVQKISEGAGNGGNTSLSPSSQTTLQATPVEQINQEEYEQNRTQLNYEARVKRLGVAINTLEVADPLIVEHLEKLASIAANKPDQFRGLISMLDLY